MFNASGKLVWRGVVDGYDIAVEVESTPLKMRFPGQYAILGNGLYYNYHRDYDPSIGRYIQSDPIGLAGGMNTYAYVGGNPVMYVDPTGEFGLFGAAVGSVIGGVSAFTGAIATGASVSDAAIAGGIGALVGAGTGFFGGVGVGASFLIGGGSNLLGQGIGNNIDDDLCNNTNINWWSVAGSAYGGAWAAGITRGASPFWAAYHGWAPTTAASALGTAIGKQWSHDEQMGK
jgi:RHS repeat-associated protein